MRTLRIMSAERQISNFYVFYNKVGHQFLLIAIFVHVHRAQGSVKLVVQILSLILGAFECAWLRQLL